MLILPLLALQLLAPDSLAQTPPPFESRFQKMKDRCLNESRAREPHTIKTVSELGYQQKILDLTLNPIGKVVHDGVDQVRYARKSKSEIATHRALLSQVDAAVDTFVAAHPGITDFQKACIATCASTHLLDYQAWSADDVEITSSIVARGRGLCRHFAQVADHFMSEVGVPSRSVSGKSKTEQHAWVSVKIAGQRYWMEPQHDDCTFYQKL